METTTYMKVVTWGKEEIIEYSDVYDIIESYTKKDEMKRFEQGNMSFLKDTSRKELKHILSFIKKWKY